MDENPLLAEKFLWWLHDIRASERYFIDENKRTNQEKFMQPPGPWGPYIQYYFANVATMMWNKDSEDWAVRADVSSRPEASWRRMPVTQPAVVRLTLVYAPLHRKKMAQGEAAGSLFCGGRRTADRVPVHVATEQGGGDECSVHCSVKHV